jgi:hypothetical protein
MDSPNMIAKTRTGLIGLMVPFGVKPSSPDRCPSWKIHVITPYMADSDRTFITMAWRGSTTDPKARNSSTKVAAATISAIHGRVAPMLDSSSARAAVGPPTCARAPAGGATARTRLTMARACGL